MSVSISFERLHVLGPGGTELPLSHLEADSRCDIHGSLRISVRGRDMPCLGYHGPDDVCFSTWIPVLKRVMHSLEADLYGEYVFDEGEQGQPAFRFLRRGVCLELSVVNSTMGDGLADPDWQGVSIPFEEFRRKVLRLVANVREEIVSAAPNGGQRWWGAVTRS